MTSLTAQVEGPKVRGSRKFLIGVVFALGVLMVGLIFFSHRGLYQIYRFRHDQVLLDQENARLAEENARLTRTIDRLQNDPEMIQEFIRRELNFVKKNEIIFQLPPGRENKQAVPTPVSNAVSTGEPQAKPESSPAGGKPSWVWRFLEGAPQRNSDNTQ